MSAGLPVPERSVAGRSESMAGLERSVGSERAAGSESIAGLERAAGSVRVAGSESMAGSGRAVAVGSVLARAEQVEAIVGRAPALVMMKQLSRLDEGCLRVLAHSPIAGVGHEGPDGERRVTFAGGAAGFVEVRSPGRISLAFPGGDSRAPVAGGGVSFVFLLPGVSETLRLNGTVAARDGSRTVVDVQEVYVHCGRCVARSQLWQPPTRPPELASPELASSELASPELASPELASPELASPELASPEPASPEPASPEPASPELAAPAPVTREPGTPVLEPLRRPEVSEFLRASAFLVLSTGDAAGGSDTSPRGDQPGFARVLDGRTLAVPDRKGNQRADTLYNLLQDDRIALAALVPGRTQVLHLHGTASITNDPALLETMALRGIAPHAALLVDVHEAELTENDAVRRSQLWDPAAHVDRDQVPSLMALAVKHATANPTRPVALPLRLALAPLAAFPRLTRSLMNVAYRSQLRKEGYGAGSVVRRWLTARPRPESRAGVPPRRVRVVAIRRETASAVTLVLQDAADPSARMNFRPGQYFTLIADIDGRSVRRAYSASSTPGAATLDVTVKRVDGGVFSAYVHEKTFPGEVFGITGPSGRFGDDLAPDVDQILMIAAGSGVTPMASIIRARLAAGPGPRLALLYGNRDESQIIFADDLARLQREHPDRLTVTHQLTRPSRTWAGAGGRIDPATLRDWLERQQPSATARYYLCGPSPLMHLVRTTLLERGVDDADIHQESYLSAVTDPAAPSTEAHRMTVVDRGVPVGSAVVDPATTLLTAGLAAGVAMPYSCTVGNCGDCMVQLRSGRVTMSRPNCLTPQQEADGRILACAAQPHSDVTVDIADLA